MASIGTKSETARARAARSGLRWPVLPRCVAQLGGTTTLGDCMVALRYLAGGPRQLVRGPVIAEYERAFAEFIGVRYAYSFSAGRVGLYGILRALGIGQGDDVLLQVPTHIVVPNAVRGTGASPVYVDCELDTYNMDLEQVERRITPATKAIILQHTFGIPVDMDAALDLARRHGLEVIEDCVHSLGATYGGRRIGSFGRAAFYSTEETKIISSTMGGMVTTDDPDLAAKIRAFQAECAWPSASLTARYILKLVVYHLLSEPYIHRYTRAVYDLVGRRHPLPRATAQEEMRGEWLDAQKQRLSNAQAELALRQLQRIEANLAHRRAAARAYSALLAGRGLDLPRPPANSEPAFVRYPVWAKDRPHSMKTAAPNAVLGNWFTSVLEEAVSPSHGGYEMGSCPRAEAVAEHLVNLPTHPRVRPQDIRRIANSEF